jgi:hypothetical protein
MHTRLQEIIKYATNGKQTPFAELMGWTPQYLHKLIKGKDFGLAPVLAILKEYPEINARWFLFGDGDMFTQSKQSKMMADAHAYITSILEMEKYLPVMTPEEITQFEQMCTGATKPAFTPAALDTWIAKLDAKEEEMNKRFEEALCNQPKAKKQ